MASKASRIQQFYSGKNVFLTGVTGYLGKVVAQRLLDTVPEIGSIYCLIRPQKGVGAQDRLCQVAKSTAFDNIRLESPQQMRKLVAIAGDMTESKLGISSTDRQRLIDDVNVVIHCAATVNFTEALNNATRLNILGPARVADLAQQMKKLDALTHVSTAYTNCNRHNLPIEEKLYESPADINELITTMKSASKAQVLELTPKYLGQRPNTYTFTKAVAEVLINEKTKNMPSSIVRPAIVGASWKYISPGWNDNKQAVTGLLASIGLGEIGTMRGDVNAISDLIPVDVVANAIIASAWWRATAEHKEMPIVNCISGDINPIKWSTVLTKTQENFKRTPLDKTYSYVDFAFQNNEFLYQVNKYMKHYLPAYARDMVAKMQGEKPKSIKTMNRVFYTYEMVDYFTRFQWDFKAKNMDKMMQLMNEDDKKKYDMDITRMDWNQYLEDFCLGIKYHVMKDPILAPKSSSIRLPSLTLPKAKLPMTA